MSRTSILNIHVILLLLSLHGQLQAQEARYEALGMNPSLNPAEVIYVLPMPDPLRIEALIEANRNSTTKTLRYALARSLSLSPEHDGVWTREGGMDVWRVHVISPGALSLELLFSSFELKGEARVFVYEPGMNEVHGPFLSSDASSSSMLSVQAVEGEELIVELQVPEEEQNYGSLQINEVAHVFLNTANDYCPAGRFGCSQDCEIDILCSEGKGWQKVGRSVVRIRAYSRDTTVTPWDYYYQYCSGVLVNNTAYDTTPYILTAEHCINFEEGAERSTFLFNYESTDCFGDEGSQSQSLYGSQLKATGRTIDYSLVELSNRPPEAFRAYYAGWDIIDFQTTYGTTIHQPWGDVKKISKDLDVMGQPQTPSDVIPGLSNYYQWDSYWWVKQWDIGTTEGGSSGGPFFNGAGHVAGVLSGGDAFCGDSIGYDWEADRTIFSKSVNVDDFFTKMSSAWTGEVGKNNGIAQFLDPTGSGTEVLDGLNTSAKGYKMEAPGSAFRVYPNPAREFLYVDDLQSQGEVSYTIFSISGVLIRMGSFHSRAEISLEGLPSGIFVLILQTRNGYSSHKLIHSEK